MSEPIVTTTDLDAYLSGDRQAALDAATAAVRAYCGWHVTPEVTETVTVDVEGCTVLLPSLYVTDVTEVRAEGEVVDAAGYEWSAAGILRVHAKRGFRTLEVTMTHGYAEAPDVAEVVLRAAARSTAVNGSDGAAFPLKSVQVGQVSEGYAVPTSWAGGSALTDEDRAVLDRYKLPPRP